LMTGFVVGEWHNNHHKNPQNWNQRVNWWEIDVSAQLVKLIKK
jgi:fatty-acid desaturase